MKKCSICGKKLPDYAVFCDGCGGEAVTVEEVAPVNVAEEFVDGVAPVALEDLPVEPVETVPQKKKGAVKWILIAAAAILCLLALVGWLTNWFGLVSPLHKLGKAMTKTFTADSFTINVTYKVTADGDTEEQEMTYCQVIDEKAETVTVYQESTSTHEGEDGLVERTSMSLIEKDKSYSCSLSNGKVSYASIAEKKNYTSDVLEQRNATKDMSWDEIIDAADLEDVLDADEMDAFVDHLYKDYFANKRWLKEEMGFIRDGNTYTFNVDLEDFVEWMIDVVDDADAFKKDARSSIKQGLKYYLEEMDESDTNLNLELSFTVEGRYLSNVHLELSGEVDGEKGRVEIDVAITDVNSTEITSAKKVKEKVNEWLEAEGIVYDECRECDDFGRVYGPNLLCSDCYYVCADCGEYGEYEEDGYCYCYDCYYTCESCGDSGCASYERDGMKVCSECRYVCEECGAVSGTYYDYNEKELCYACYKEARYRCDKCGVVSSSSLYSVNGERWCYDCYYDCYYCSRSAGYTVDGKRTCYDCRYECAHCHERCGSTYAFNGENWCVDCYYYCYYCGDFAYYTDDGKRVCYDCYRGY